MSGDIFRLQVDLLNSNDYNSWKNGEMSRDQYLNNVIRRVDAYGRHEQVEPIKGLGDTFDLLRRPEQAETIHDFMDSARANRDEKKIQDIKSQYDDSVARINKFWDNSINELENRSMYPEVSDSLRNEYEAGRDLELARAKDRYLSKMERISEKNLQRASRAYRRNTDRFKNSLDKVTLPEEDRKEVSEKYTDSEKKKLDRALAVNEVDVTKLESNEEHLNECRDRYKAAYSNNEGYHPPVIWNPLEQRDNFKDHANTFVGSCFNDNQLEKADNETEKDRDLVAMGRLSKSEHYNNILKRAHAITLDDKTRGELITDYADTVFKGDPKEIIQKTRAYAAAHYMYEGGVIKFKQDTDNLLKNLSDRFSDARFNFHRDMEDSLSDFKRIVRHDLADKLIKKAGKNSENSEGLLKEAELRKELADLKRNRDMYKNSKKYFDRGLDRNRHDHYHESDLDRRALTQMQLTDEERRGVENLQKDNRYNKNFINVWGSNHCKNRLNDLKKEIQAKKQELAKVRDENKKLDKGKSKASDLNLKDEDTEKLKEDSKNKSHQSGGNTPSTKLQDRSPSSNNPFSAFKKPNKEEGERKAVGFKMSTDTDSNEKKRINPYEKTKINVGEKQSSNHQSSENTQKSAPSQSTAAPSQSNSQSNTQSH